jgi:hypothetical protein
MDGFVEAPRGVSEHAAGLEPPNVRQSGGKLSYIRDWYRYAKRRQQKADDGYVQWFLLDGARWPEPMFINPTPKGGGIPEFEHDDVTYVFPDEALVASEREGMWTAIHVKGEAEPLNLADPSRESMDADVLAEYLTMRVTASPPSLLDGLPNISPRTILYVAIGLTIAWAALQQAMANGVI